MHWWYDGVKIFLLLTLGIVAFYGLAIAIAVYQLRFLLDLFSP